MKQNGILRGRPTYLLVIALLTAVVLLSLAAAVTLGSVDISIGEVYRVILFKTFGVGDPAVYGAGAVSDIVWFVRLPRLVLAVGVGMCLSLAGVVMQAIVRNPLADPYVLGVSSGASLGASLAILTGVGTGLLGANAPGVLAFIGAFAVSVAVVALANLGGRANAVKLLLAGTALSSVCAAFSNFLLYLSASANAAQTLMRWTMGSLAGAEWPTNIPILVISLLGLLFFWSQFRTLNLMLLGDDTALTLGVDLHHRRLAYLLVASLLVGCAVYTAGLIGFVGLVIPHIVRILFGSDHKKIVPISALLGAIFLLWADVLCRVLIPGAELPIGVLTAMIGAPCFIWLMIRRKYGFGGGD